MRAIQIACQLSFCPRDRKECNQSIDRVLELIVASGLQTEIGSMSTIIHGDAKDVLNLIEKIIRLQEKNGAEYIVNMAISNICGCD
jgi:uncharacterized protein YqgV (UPF0045/DUF77 family)